MRNYWFKILFIKLLVFILPFAVMLALDAFILPPDFFTFRAWEALKVKQFYPTLTGPFYPNQQLELTELGELAPYTEYAVPKRAVWITDEYGYRNRPSTEKPQVLILGDSFCAGVKLSQEETLPEVLTNQLGQRVYGLAPAPDGFELVNTYLATDRFRKEAPKVVIYERNEGYLHLLAPISGEEAAYIRTIQHRSDHLPKAGVAQKMAIGADRLVKKNWYHWASSGIDRTFTPPDPIVYNDEVFTFGEQALAETPHVHIERLVRLIISYRDTIQRMGARFVFVPVPNKENIYHELLPSGRKPALLCRLISRLREEGVQVVDLQMPFDSAYAAGARLYPRDDGHWNPEAVRIAAREITRVINGTGNSSHLADDRKAGIRMVKRP